MRQQNFRHARRVEIQARARYYSWCALRGHALPGNDPQSGRPRGAWTHRAESRAAYIAMARYWLAQAAAGARHV